MGIRDLAGKRVCILGFGKEGRAMAQALEEFAPDCSITIADKNEKIQIPHLRQGFGGQANYKLQVGIDYLNDLNRFDVIVKSPGIPPLQELKPHTSKLTTSTQIFLDSIRDSGATVIGVTGSKGKSTTASLIYEILRNHISKAEQQPSVAAAAVYLVGNIGEPAIAHLKDAKKNTFFVQEMSSYQLMDLTSSPHIAVVTSFFPEHLDYHASTSLSTSGSPLENYLEAKKHITRFQTKDDVVIFNTDSKEAKEIADESKGKKIPFSPKDSPVQLSDINLLGEHNLGNIAAAYKTAIELGVDEATTIDAIRKFRGLPHRLESIAIKDGTEWINDSISTTPETAIAALNALGDRVTTIILGGQDRGYDFSELGKRIKQSKVQTVILLPDTGAKIRAAIEKADATVTFVEATTMSEAVKAAQSTRSTVVLMSPASPSYNLFKNFEDRGDQFRKLVQG